MIKELFNNLFKYEEKEEYNFILPKVANNIDQKEFNKKDSTTVNSILKNNKDYLNVKYNMLINSDIKLREFTITIKPKNSLLSLFILMEW